MRGEREKEAAGPAGLCPCQLLLLLFLARTIDPQTGGRGRARRAILYLRRIYAYFHLASYTIPDTVDVPRQVGSLVPTVGESASTFSLDPKFFLSFSAVPSPGNRV